MKENPTGSGQNGIGPTRIACIPTLDSGPPDEIRALNTFIKLSQATDRLGAKLQQSIGKLGLTPCQLWVLGTLLDDGPMSQRELRRKLLASDPDLTAALDNLEQHGMIRREWSSGDRHRIVVVSATEEGRRLIERVYPAYARRLTELMSILSDVEQEELGLFCARLGTGIAADAQ